LGLVGKKIPPLSLLALFQGFWILTLISTLGPWGYPPVVELSEKMRMFFVFFAVGFTPGLIKFGILQIFFGIGQK
jgi:hypothetical protein